MDATDSDQGGEPADPRRLAGDLHRRLDRIEQLLTGGTTAPGARPSRHGPPAEQPAWRRETEGEQRWAVTAAVLLAAAVQWSLPPRLSFRPHWLLPLLEVVLLIGLFAANPRRIRRRSPLMRSASLALAALVSVANGWSAAALVRGLVLGREGEDAGPLLMTGAGIWLTNVIVFALWYWEWDRGGPVHRAAGTRQYPDFLFPQMQESALAPPGWEPGFLDYFYLSFTNATAFSPTDVMPLSRWAKMLMLAQSAVSLITVALVIARAVNILK
ncbi:MULTISPECIES: DUF1345 domain-containing protein [Streptomycetaceae]|uniref:DUF1345 domain-containing protein n=1 Tax=Streptantibioticus cattleyicolor (strain ATCC 35852 / DSM 46488 / JCM 4925 / NBRC 14057 / NRRL 8057) TaxID=1003195 RepID=F8JNW3_STREN|nr:MULTISPECIES: DUF1345 domain-containing protein [Streptomycetaceae]AEW92698.1 hypothetical protein SCATT_03270 [Streptantibioticus cattleyicolor NRRL 8057 = DSM 46488]MYS57466.1 DUF1345 domain-containing protein [Streptomyces sp. SID5468]CCB73054.1 conserved membrane protein of unknown function [Streptantibioticus cattleyicolor NRRL 8057 = DSM 46488]